MLEKEVNVFEEYHKDDNINILVNIIAVMLFIANGVIYNKYITYDLIIDILVVYNSVLTMISVFYSIKLHLGTEFMEYYYLWNIYVEKTVKIILNIKILSSATLISNIYIMYSLL